MGVQTRRREITLLVIKNVHRQVTNHFINFNDNWAFVHTQDVSRVGGENLEADGSHIIDWRKSKYNLSPLEENKSLKHV